jgi:DNA primase
MKVNKNVDYKQMVDECLDDRDIFYHYLGVKDRSGVFCSPLRNDKNPSCSLYYSSSGNMRFKDHATGQNFSAVAFVQELYKLNYPEALRKIVADFGLYGEKFEAKPILKILDKPEIVKKNVDIKIIPKKFTEADLEYWSSYGIRYETLKLFNVYSVESLWIKKNPFPIKKNELCFAYYFPKSNHLKIYFPTRPKGKKWYSNTDNICDIQGYYQMNIKSIKTDTLILTSSMKEVMLLWENGIKSMAIHGENATFDSDFIRHIKKYCNNIYSLYDWDEAGYNASAKLEELYGIKPIQKPDNLVCKDVSDCYKDNKENTVEFLKNLAYGKYTK